MFLPDSMAIAKSTSILRSISGKQIKKRLKFGMHCALLRHLLNFVML